jgi:hypothetical protein
VWRLSVKNSESMVKQTEKSNAISVTVFCFKASATSCAPCAPISLLQMFSVIIVYEKKVMSG